MTDLPDDEPQPGSRASMEQTAQLDSAMATARRNLSALNAQDHPSCKAPGWTASRLHRPSTRSLTGTAGVKVSMPPRPATPGPTPTTSGERPTPANVHRGSDFADQRSSGRSSASLMQARIASMRSLSSSMLGSRPSTSWKSSSRSEHHVVTKLAVATLAVRRLASGRDPRQSLAPST